MSKDDWAIVVGINGYPGLGDLKGPENDAVGFYGWLKSKTGGNIPVKETKTNGGPAPAGYKPLAPGHQIRLIRSSDFTPAANPFTFAEPTEAHVYQAFNELKHISDSNRMAGNGPRIGRRLYLFFSGHGFAPNFDDAAILMANADTESLGYHIPGKPWALWFLIASCFDEVVLFMDCCRDNYTSIGLNGVKFKPITGAHTPDESSLFFGFGTKWNRRSREREFNNKRWQGVFTTALLDGLRGEAADQTTGKITARTLGSFLTLNMKNYLDPADLQDPSVEKTPSLRYDPTNGDALVFVEKATVSSFSVEIEIPPELIGQDLVITNGTNEQVIPTVIGSPVIQITLPRGIYRASIAERKSLFEVTGGAESQSEEVTRVKFV